MKTIIEKQRETTVSQRCDVLVAGGGVAGIAAALSAARAGRDVLLVEKQCMLGGLATIGLITYYLPLCDGEGHQVSFGICEELFRLSIKHGWETEYPKAWLEGGTIEERIETRFKVRYNPHLFAVEAERLLRKEGVRILYDTLLCDTIVENGKITHVVIENKSGRSAVEVGSVVDSTGDADLCVLAGAKTALFAPQNILASWYYYVDKNPGYELRTLGCADIPEDRKVAGQQGVKPLINRRFSGIDAEENSEMICLAHDAMIYEVLKKREDDPTHTPVTMPSIPLLRMTRRIDGVTVLSHEDAHKHVENSIGMIGDWRRRGPIHEIPFTALYGNEVKNLITAGRNISSNDAMWDRTRVIPACAVTGEAAGLAAALTDDFTTLDVSVLQERLVKNGVVLHESDLEM